MVKVISLSEAAYARLVANKGDKSFSEVVVEFVPEKRKRDIMEFAGAFKDNAREWEIIEKKIYKDRKKFKLRTFKRQGLRLRNSSLVRGRANVILERAQEPATKVAGS